ncbi:RHO1 GDP-GTP exchange protein 2 [Mucor velutinosus]|uniref:RHO1 GDP-GTP exchange protein 2 n=1 Tax=Mucor velutinosus TaxID=708070 RepID=A0AAN7HRE1_9FUNG|nr:RHO1 GDP-GTP exchange protein 2 [Mucor velutinosus]
MPNRTIDFRQLVETKAALLPSSSQRKPHSSPRHHKETDEHSYDLFTKEAYRIYQHITSLKRFLITIRPAYLSTSKRSMHRSSQQRQTQHALDTGNTDSLFAIFAAGNNSLTDRERDEIDFQAKLIIRRCIDRIKELEESEKIRQRNEASKPASRLAHFLGTLSHGGGGHPSGSGSMPEDVLFVHRSSMTWFLNQQLMQVSQIQKDQQEIRLTREIEKSENQLSKSTYAEPVYRPDVDQQQAPAPQDENPFEQALSQEQIQMLEKENSIMLEDLNNTLNQVKSAEKALLEISTLQTQLTNHLAAQTIQTDKLYADAIATTEKVEQGNLQLITARERNKGSRNFMLVFLLGASFVLLFLDWYS